MANHLISKKIRALQESLWAIVRSWAYRDIHYAILCLETYALLQWAQS